MARPLVLVFQDLAQPQASPTTPDLNTIVIGPAYDLFDYPDDAATILLAQTYGQLEQGDVYAPPVTGAVAVTVLGGAYPGQSAGSLVDHASVKVYLKSPRVILGSTYLSSTIAPVFGGSVTTSSSDQTLIAITSSATTDFVAAGIQPGDRVILTSSLSSPKQVFVSTVLSVGEPNAAGLITSGNEVKLRISANLPAAGSSVSTWTYDTNTEIRIERTLATQQFVDTAGSFFAFPNPGSDDFNIKGAVTMAVALTPAKTVSTPTPATTSVLRSLSYSQVYLGYRALRQDLQTADAVTNSAVVPVNGVPTITPLGKIDARNPLAAGVFVALQNSGGAQIYYLGVPSDDAAGHAIARAAISSRSDLYCEVPLTQDMNIIASYNFENVSYASPLTAADTGVSQKFRVVIGSPKLPTSSVVYPGSLSGVASIPSGALTSLNRTITIANASAIDLSTVLPGDQVVIGLTPTSDAQWQNRRGVHRVSHVNSCPNYPTSGSTSDFELVPGSSRWNDSTLTGGAGDIELLITGQDGAVKVKKLAEVAISTGSGGTLGTVKYSMKVPTLVGGPYTVTYAVTGGLTDVAVSLVGFAITVTVNGTSHTHTNVAAAVNANVAVSALLSASVTAGGSQVVALPTSPTGAVQIMPASGACTANVATNDGLYNILTDSSASFLTAGVKPGDSLEFPVDPNNYASTAFDVRVLSYKVAQVLSENAVQIANGLDDTDAAANELPHLFTRDVASRFIDNTLPNALNYRVRRALTKDQQVLALVSIAAGFRSKRTTLTWPDQVGVAGLLDGSLPRAVASVRAAAGPQPGFYIGCQVGGALAGLPPQQGLTNLGMAGVSTLYHSQNYFSEPQLAQLSDGGLFVMMQRNPTDLPFCIHQLTTDITAIETGELSVVKNADFLSIFLRNICEPFLGQYNVLPETLQEINRALNDGADNLKTRKIAKIGAPLIDGSVTTIKVADFAADRIQVYFTGRIPRPLNSIELHVVI